jgi:hypothetical protein
MKEEGRFRFLMWWERQANLVSDFGASGDGIANDSWALQAAIEAVAARGGGEILIPPLTFGIGTPVRFRDCVTLVGCGTPPSGAGGNPPFVGSCFKAIASMPAMFTQADLSSPLHSIGMRRCTVDAGQANGLRVNNAVLMSFVNSRFTQNFFRQGTGTGFTDKFNPRGTAWINWFSENYVEFFNVGVLWEGSDSFIHHNYISSCLSYNMIIDSTGGNQITGNQIDGCGRNNLTHTTNRNAVALLMRNTHYKSKQTRNVLTGNHFGENQANDIRIEDFSGGGTMDAGHVITGNLFHNLPGNSIHIGEGNRGGVIMGNDFSDIGDGSGCVVFNGDSSKSPGWSLGPNSFSNGDFGLKYVNVPAGTTLLGQT